MNNELKCKKELVPEKRESINNCRQKDFDREQEIFDRKICNRNNLNILFESKFPLFQKSSSSQPKQRKTKDTLSNQKNKYRVGMIVKHEENNGIRLFQTKNV